MKKKIIANIVMVTIIVVIAAAGILTAGHIQGWFDSDNGESAVLTQLRGIITMERDGIAYTAEVDTVLRSGDRIATGSGASAVIRIGSDALTLGENAELTIGEPAADRFAATVKVGEFFVNAPVTLSFDGKTVAFHDTVAALRIRSGSQSISVFAGSVEEADAGQLLEWIGGERFISDLKISALNDFTMAQVRLANENKFLCFSNEELDAEMQKREEEMQAMLNATEPEETPEPTEPETEPTAPPTEEAPTEAALKPTEPAEKETRPVTPPTEKPTEKPSEKPTEKPTEVPAQAPTEAPTEVPTKPKNTCTITIRCDTILSNMDNLDPAKAGFVPSSGCILSTKTVEFTEGETVFDVLKRVCSAYGIQLEYSWTPMYDSYYIEGINNLYEFDCGSESGWMYKVNGWYPNYGCSGYKLKNGDSIAWCYTCVGLGADLWA